ncbi:helix-turn-helix transcriptional regulator [Aeromonas sp. R10-2]|uniref:helix-turn-helix transcriptional regulator n=1 Tax=Aeromonas sp. R10-2 TaxID=3138458 RepID=UPI0034A2E70C
MMESENENQIGNTDPFLRSGIGSFPERLTEVIGTQSVRSFAEEIGLSEGAVRAFLKGRLPRADDALAIARAKGVDLVWLLSGSSADEPASANLSTHALNEESKKHHNINAISDASICYKWEEFDEEYALIDGYHISVSAGHGAFNDDHSVKRRLAFRRKWLKYRQLNPDNLVVVFAKGDSMEPTIHSGDSILVDISRNQIQDGGLFVLRLGDELYAKRLQKRVDGGVNIISDNKTGYETLAVMPNELDSLSIIGKVVWLGHDFF